MNTYIPTYIHTNIFVGRRKRKRLVGRIEGVIREGGSKVAMDGGTASREGVEESREGKEEIHIYIYLL